MKKKAKIEHYFNGGKKKPGDDATASGIADEEEEEAVNSETGKSHNKLKLQLL